MTESSPALLEMAGISKSFGGVHALRDVDFSLHTGEIHGLVGENGAGKSTLMKIIAGVHGEFTGTMRLAGEDVHFRSARDALNAGIGMVHQELSTAPDLTVAENVYLGKQPVTRFGTIDWGGMARGARAQLAKLGIDVDPKMRMGDLSIGLQQLIELARVLFSGARIIILDEPTSALSPPEVERLFTVLKRLKESGLSIIFISHFLDDILRISDTVTIFRNGRKIITHATQGIDKAWVIERMIGRGHQELEESYLGEIMLDSRPSAPVVLEASGLACGRDFRNISLSVRAGELFAFLGPRLWRYDYRFQPDIVSDSSPSLSHPFGTSRSGHDLLGQVMRGTQQSLRVAALDVTGPIPQIEVHPSPVSSLRADAARLVRALVHAHVRSTVALVRISPPCSCRSAASARGTPCMPPRTRLLPSAWSTFANR